MKSIRIPLFALGLFFHLPFKRGDYLQQTSVFLLANALRVFSPPSHENKICILCTFLLNSLKFEEGINFISAKTKKKAPIDPGFETPPIFMLPDSLSSLPLIMGR